MEKSQVITDLENAGAVSVVEGEPYTDGGSQVTKIFYRTSIDADTYSKVQSLQLVQIGTEYFFHGSKPPILRTSTPPRDFHKTAEWIKTRFNQAFTGWTARKVDQRLDGDDDIVTIEAINPNEQIVEKRVKMWMDGTNVQFKEIV